MLLLQWRLLRWQLLLLLLLLQCCGGGRQHHLFHPFGDGGGEAKRLSPELGEKHSHLVVLEELSHPCGVAHPTQAVK